LRKRKKLVLICLGALLALLCVAGMELAFCAGADPDLFRTVTAAVDRTLRPVQDGLYRAGQVLTDSARSSAAACHAWLTTYTALAAPGGQIQVLTAPQTGADAALQETPDPADAAVTVLKSSEGREVLTGGVEMVYYNQKDEAWAQASFGGDPVGRYGCGPTALAMAVSSMTDADVDPAEMAEWCAGQGYRAVKSGSYLTIVGGTAEEYGLNCVSLPLDDPDGLRQALEDGGVAVALMGPGHFTTGGHFILLHGVAGDGRLLVADPNSRENSLILWDAQLILDELSDSRSGGAPLWLLTNLHRPGD